MVNSDIEMEVSLRTQYSTHDRNPESSSGTVIPSPTLSGTPVSRHPTLATAAGSTSEEQPVNSENSKDEPVKSPQATRPGYPDCQSSRDDDYTPTPSLRTSFEPLSTFQEPPQPLNPYELEVPKWPANPSTLEEKTSKLISIASWVFEVLLVTILPIGTIALCIVARLHDGKLVELYPWSQKILQFTTIGVTIYSTLFSALVGRTVEKMASYLALKGTRLINLERLLGSMSIVNTIWTQYKLGLFNLNVISFLLILLWSFSPLGGQAILRIVSTEIGFTNGTTPLAYFNTSFSTGNVSYLNNNAALLMQFMDVRSIYGSAVISPSYIQESSMDQFGNVKIPMIESLDSSSADKDGWIPVPTDNVVYSSLIGSPLRGIQASGRSQFRHISSYFHLNCTEPLFLNHGVEIFWSLPNSSSLCVPDQKFLSFGSNRIVNGAIQGTFSIGSLQDNHWDASFAKQNWPMLQRRIIFQSASYFGVTVSNCTVRYPTVESDITCSGTNCSVTQIREYNSTSPELSPLEDCITAANFYTQFAALGSPYSIIFNNYSIPSQTERYLMVGKSPISMGSSVEVEGMDVSSATLTNISSLTGELMSERLARLMNTFWMASLVPEYIGGGMSTLNVSNSDVLKFHPVIFTNATWGVGGNVYVCNNYWLSILIISSIILLCVGVTGMWFKDKLTGPEIFGKVSSLTRDNPYMRIPEGGSTLDGFERAKLLKDVIVKLGDVQSEDVAVGHIAFASVEKGGNGEVGTLTRDRLYF